MSITLAFLLGFLVCLVIVLFLSLATRNKPRIGDPCPYALLINQDGGQARLPCRREIAHDGCHAAHTEGTGFDVWWRTRKNNT